MWFLLALLAPDGTASVRAQPSPAALREIETRRAHLRAMQVWDARPPHPPKKADLDEALGQLDAALASKDGHVYAEAARDLVNGRYRSFPPEQILKRLLPRLKAAEKLPERVSAQGMLIDYLRRLGPGAKAALPDLLRLVTDGTAPVYLRSQAITAAGKIAPGDRAVIAAFIEALNNPEPRNTSGVHDRLAESLGDMGPAARPARKALVGLMRRGPWYADVAFVALGKIGMDSPPRPLADYLGRLARLDRLPVEEVAPAFLHVQKACNPPAAIRPPHYASVPPANVDLAQLKSVDAARAARARPVLLKIVAGRPGDDIYVRAALRTLAVIGPGSSARAAQALAGAVTSEPFGKTYMTRAEAGSALALLEPRDRGAVKPLAAALDRLLDEKYHDWVSCQTLAQLLARYGREARPAVPVLLRALTRPRDPLQAAAHEELAACADALAVAGPDAPGARATLLRLLAPGSPLLKKAGPDAPGLQASLLQSLGKMGLPAAGRERDETLARLLDALGGADLPFMVAANFIAAHGPAFTEKEARSLVPELARALSVGRELRHAQATADLLLRFTQEEHTLGARGLAVRALGALGPAARGALPQLEALARRPLVEVKSPFLAEPALNHAIREARKAVRLVRGERK